MEPSQTASTHRLEIRNGERFEFGENWSRFLSVLDEERIATATESLRSMLGVTDLVGRSFIDVGSGSGLFSLAARRLGATVVSFDYDPKSVNCALELRNRYFPGDVNWTIHEGSVLDGEFLARLGRFDVVYSWGVLHHTGRMWAALDNVGTLMNERGTLFIAIYNDQGPISAIWTRVKKVYCSGALGRLLVKAVWIPYFALRQFAIDILLRRNPVHGYTQYKRQRGMSRIHDWYDWLGGYPFEVAKPEDIFSFYRDRGLVLARLKTCGGRLGCNEFVFNGSAAK